MYKVIFGQLFPELTEEERLYCWFQQDSATAHIASISSETELSAVVFGHYIRPNLILRSFPLELFEGQSLQQ
jgi:hypothetical protein